METEQSDDFLVVIVGDEEDEGKKIKDDESEEYVNVKEEVLDCEEESLEGMEVEYLIETAEKHGQLIDVSEIKEEPSNTEYLEDSDYQQSNDDELSDQEVFTTSKYRYNVDSAREKHRYKMVHPLERKSFVKDLCAQHPELIDDKNLLIETLCKIMRSIKPPPHPENSYSFNGELYECGRCDALLDTAPAASRHYQEKHGQRYLICLACGVDFRSTTNLYKHEKRCDAPDAVAVLKARALLLGRKGRGRPFVPPLDAIMLREKLKIKKTFACSQCPAQYKSNAGLLCHELAHGGVRPYYCDQCPAAYTSKAGLSKHFAKHSNVEYICDHCKRSFKLKQALISHLNTHLAERKFVCAWCGRRFAARLALTAHEDRAHRLLPPPCACQICPKRYPRMSLLKKHMLKEHGMNLVTKKMFYQSLPMMSTTQIQQAKIVLKSEVQQSRYNELDFDEEQNNEQEIRDDNLCEEVMGYLQNFQGYENAETIVIENGEVVEYDQKSDGNSQPYLQQEETDKYYEENYDNTNFHTGSEATGERYYILHESKVGVEFEVEPEEKKAISKIENNKFSVYTTNVGSKVEVELEVEPGERKEISDILETNVEVVIECKSERNVQDATRTLQKIRAKREKT